MGHEQLGIKKLTEATLARTLDFLHKLRYVAADAMCVCSWNTYNP